MPIPNFRQLILDYVYHHYSTSPEFLWKRYPDYAVLRHQDNRKWYAIIMDVARVNLGLEGEGRVDVINLKCPAEMVDDFLQQTGFLPAYHMNKANWITVLLDGSVDQDTLFFLLNGSFDITATKQTKRALQIDSQTEWIVPANPKYYDVEKDLHEGGIILWKQSNNVAVDDIVYIYVTAPTAAIRYQCLVLEVNIPHKSKHKDLRVDRVMRIQCLKEYSPAQLSRDILRQFGISAVRGPRRMPKILSDEIASWQ